MVEYTYIYVVLQSNYIEKTNYKETTSGTELNICSRNSSYYKSAYINIKRTMDKIKKYIK